MSFILQVDFRFDNFSCVRYLYTEEDVKESDVVIPVGGDGTFLVAASMVTDNQKPVVGFNSDPNRSEGYLCLPKKYSTNIRDAIERLNSVSIIYLLLWMVNNR